MVLPLPAAENFPVTHVALSRLPWRRTLAPAATLPKDWCRPDALVAAINAWRHWLADKPGGRWLLFERDPASFCAALLALWESGRSAVLPGDDRTATLTRLSKQLDGVIPAAAPAPNASDLPPPEPLAADAEALVLYTSGSTGEPLMQVKRFGQLEAELAVQAELWPLDGGAVISQVSHQHIYGLLTGVLRPLCHGIPLCGGNCHYPEVMARRLAEVRHAGLKATLISSPAQLSRLPDHLNWEQAGAPQRIFSSGAPLAAEHAQHAETLLAAPVIEIYGSTETGGIAHRRQTRADDWQPLPGVEIRLEDAQLQVRSAFLQAPRQWWQQADRAEATAQGFRLLGRADRLIKLAGKRVSLTAIERDLAALPDVKQAHCTRVAQQHAERLGAVVVLAEDALPQTHAERRALIERLRQHLAASQESIALPRYWRFVAELPTNAQGKLDRTRLDRLFADLNDNRLPRWLGERHDGPHKRHISLEVPERLVFLEGHFDDFPLVPGVVMVQWAIEQARACFGPCHGFRGVERLKFQRPLWPGTRCTLQLEYKHGTIMFRLESRQAQHAAGRLRFASPVGLETENANE
jgi:acyl-CoA synthetase (AMP-forming)/AMP-acid ligase II